MSSQIESMTGYAEVRTTLKGVVLVCRVKSLNHRFLDVKLRLPRADWTSLEMSTRKLLAQTFTRGSVEFNLSAEVASETHTEVQVNTTLAKAYLAAAHELATDLKGGVANLSLDALFRLPGVIGAAHSAGSSSEELLAELDEGAILEQLVNPALQSLKTARQSEGKKLLAHFEQLIAQMFEHLKGIKALEEPEKEKARALITERAQETMKLLTSLSSQVPNAEEFAARMREEAVFWVERRDFDEERVRLEMHLNSFKDLVNSPEGVSGRKLEFLQQELQREVNTLGTKAQSAAITSHTIEMKTILERIKEQLANVA